MLRDRRPLAALTGLFGAALLAVPAAAQTPIVPLDTLVANHGSVTAGDVTFSNFQKPTLLPRQVGVFLTEFNDIGVTATVVDGSTVTLRFVGIDPNTGLASPLRAGPDFGGDVLRLLSYTTTVTNPALRMHSVRQAFGPGTFLPSDGSYSLIFNILNGVEPILAGSYPLWVDPLREDTFYAPGYPVYETLFPGGNLPTYTMENEFGMLKGHIGTPAGGTMDSIDITFSLVPTGTVAPVVITNLPQPGDIMHGSAFPTTIPNGFAIEPTAGILQFFLTDYAQDGGAVIALSSSNPSAFPLPASVTVAQGSYNSPPTYLGPTNVDFPTVVTLTASFNGRTQTQNFTANPATPLVMSLLAGTPMCGSVPCTLNLAMYVNVSLNRLNVSPETITFTSSNPAICPIQASYTVAALTPSGSIPSFKLACKAVAVDTAITFTATMNGVTSTVTGTLYRTIDFPGISKAELVVKNLSLKVDATSQVAGDTLTLYNAVTGQVIGNMTQTGTLSLGAKYSFQGTITAPVTTLLVKSGLNGSATFTVSQK